MHTVCAVITVLVKFALRASEVAFRSEVPYGSEVSPIGEVMKETKNALSGVFLFLYLVQVFGLEMMRGTSGRDSSMMSSSVHSSRRISRSELRSAS